MTPIRPIVSFIFCLLLCLCGLHAQELEEGNLTIQVNNAKSDEGNLILDLFGSKHGFPKKTKKAIFHESSPIKDGAAQITISNLPFGEYAIVVFHDANANGKLEHNFFGIPREGAGASNDSRELLNPPRFKEAKFDFKSAEDTMIIKLKYY